MATREIFFLGDIEHSENSQRIGHTTLNQGDASASSPPQSTSTSPSQPQPSVMASPSQQRVGSDDDVKVHGEGDFSGIISSNQLNGTSATANQHQEPTTSPSHDDGFPNHTNISSGPNLDAGGSDNAKSGSTLSTMTVAVPKLEAPLLEPSPPLQPSSSTTTPSNRLCRRQYSQKNKTSEPWFTFDCPEDTEGRSELHNILKEREEHVKKVKRQQEEERMKKADEIRQQALIAEKFRLELEAERRRGLEEAKAKERDKRKQIEERRNALESAERERRELLMKKNMAREERLLQRRKSQMNSHLNFAFGSSTPRMKEPKIDSSSDAWPAAATRRSTSSTNVHANLMTQSLYSRSSLERETGCSVPGRSAVVARGASRHSGGTGATTRSASVYGLDKSGNEGDVNLMTRSFCERSPGEVNQAGLPGNNRGVRTPAYRRRTDLVPTIVASSPRGSCSGEMSRGEVSRASTPGHRIMSTRLPASGTSREGSVRSPSAMSATDSSKNAPVGGSSSVRMRSSHPRKPRPLSIAVTGINQHQQQSTLSSVGTSPSSTTGLRQKKLYPSDYKSTPTKQVRPITKNVTGVDGVKNSKETAQKPSPKTPTVRKTPAQVKAESAARKANKGKDKLSSAAMTSSLYVPSTLSSPAKDVPQRSLSTEDLSFDGDTKRNFDAVGNSYMEETGTEEPNKRNVTPDIIKTDSPTKDVFSYGVKDTVAEKTEGAGSPDEMYVATSAKKIIVSEEEAKAKLAEKRRQVKELERQRQAELEREAEERRLKEEEEERKAVEEAERLASVARKAEEERLRKAIEEAERKEEMEKCRKAEEENAKKEAEKKAIEEANRKQAELEEKFKKEQEERMARKKRIDEIMARSRGGGGNKVPLISTSASLNQNKTVPSCNNGSVQEEKGEIKESNQQDTMLSRFNGSYTPVSTEDPSLKPDLLDDLVRKNNITNMSIATTASDTTYDSVNEIQPVHQRSVANSCSTERNHNHKNEEAEKDACTLIGNDDDDDDERHHKQQRSLLDLTSSIIDPPLSVKASYVHSVGQQTPTPQFDQILDLSENVASNKILSSNGSPQDAGSFSVIGPPLIAFEENPPSSNKQEGVMTAASPTADILM